MLFVETYELIIIVKYFLMDFFLLRKSVIYLKKYIFPHILIIFTLSFFGRSSEFYFLYRIKNACENM
jgi:hypothetical protein